MRKGQVVELMLVVTVALVALVIGEGVYVQNYVAQIDFTKRSAMETAVIESYNIVEFSKKAMQEAVQFSFYKAAVEVTKMGGFCAYSDAKSCSEICKIPDKVPTQRCVPWWRVYDKAYNPSLKGLESALENGTSKYYQEYSVQVSAYGLGTNKYCPRPPGIVKIEGDEVSLNNIGAMSYAGSFFTITEKNSNFTDRVESTVFELHKTGADNFIDKDGVGNAFSDADNSMPNKCDYMSNGKCDMTAGNCQSNNCWDSACCCKGMYFGDMCENSLPSCEGKLSSFCSKADATKIGGCNFNNDNVVSADEKYNCTVQQSLNDLASSASTPGVIQTSVGIDNCIKVGHASQQDYQNMGNAEGMAHGCSCKHCVLDCSGAASCSNIHVQAYCDNGCSWQSGHCEGTASFSCDDFDGSADSVICSNMDTDKCTGHGCSASTSCAGPPAGGDYWDWLKGVSCNYDYYGTANTSVRITDVANSYPANGWAGMSLPFYIVSGNVACSNGGDLCCPAVATDEERQWKDCKAAA